MGGGRHTKKYCLEIRFRLRRTVRFRKQRHHPRVIRERSEEHPPTRCSRILFILSRKHEEGCGFREDRMGYQAFTRSVIMRSSHPSTSPLGQDMLSTPVPPRLPQYATQRKAATRNQHGSTFRETIDGTTRDSLAGTDAVSEHLIMTRAQEAPPALTQGVQAAYFSGTHHLSLHKVAPAKQVIRSRLRTTVTGFHHAPSPNQGTTSTSVIPASTSKTPIDKMVRNRRRLRLSRPSTPS